MPLADIRRAANRRSSVVVGRKGRSSTATTTSYVDIIYEVTLPSQPRIRERVRYLAAELLEQVDGPHKSTKIF